MQSLRNLSPLFSPPAQPGIVVAATFCSAASRRAAGRQHQRDHRGRPGNRHRRAPSPKRLSTDKPSIANPRKRNRPRQRPRKPAPAEEQPARQARGRKARSREARGRQPAMRLNRLQRLRKHPTSCRSPRQVAPLKAGDWNQWGGTSLRNNTPDRRERHRPIGTPASSTARPAPGIRPKPRTSSGSPRSAARPTATPVVATGKVFVGTNNSNGYLKRYPGRHRSGLPALLRREGRQVPLAALQRKASHRPRPRLAAAGHLLLAAGRRGPALVRHQPRRSAAASMPKASTTARTTARSNGRARPPVRHRCGPTTRPRTKSAAIRGRARRRQAARRRPRAKFADRRHAAARRRHRSQGRRQGQGPGQDAGPSKPRSNGADRDFYPHARRPAALGVQDHHAGRQGRSRRDLGRST